MASFRFRLVNVFAAEPLLGRSALSRQGVAGAGRNRRMAAQPQRSQQCLRVRFLRRQRGETAPGVGALLHQSPRKRALRRSGHGIRLRQPGRLAAAHRRIVAGVRRRRTRPRNGAALPAASRRRRGPEGAGRRARGGSGARRGDAAGVTFRQQHRGVNPAPAPSRPRRCTPRPGCASPGRLRTAGGHRSGPRTASRPRGRERRGKAAPPASRRAPARTRSD